MFRRNAIALVLAAIPRIVVPSELDGNCPTWNTLLADYHHRREAMLNDERDWTEAQADAYNQAIRELMHCPAPSLAAVEIKLGIFKDEGCFESCCCDEYFDLITADIRRF